MIGLLYGVNDSYIINKNGAKEQEGRQGERRGKRRVVALVKEAATA